MSAEKPSGPSLPRPELQLDPITVALVMMIAALLRARRSVAEQRKQLKFSTFIVDRAGESNGILAAHTRRLAKELFDAQVELQTSIAADVDPDGGFWDEASENDSLGAALTVSEDPPNGLSRRPCEDC